jgi:predicted phosphoadenosine phosphosulfate sulfurtransferase
MDSQTHFPIKVQEMRSKGKKPRYYVYLPMALASALGLQSGEEVAWELLDRDELHLIRLAPPPPSTQKRADQQQIS